MKITVSAVQMTSTDDKEENLRRAEDLVSQAVHRGSSIVALPENFAFLRSEGESIPCAQEIRGEFISRMQRIARVNGIYLLCGSIPEKSSHQTKIYNTSVLLDPAGEICVVYRKIHLFDVNLKGRATFQESRHVESGTEVITANTQWGTVGLTVCYDLRFPELYRLLTLQGARIIFVPSAFTEYTGKDHWEVLLRARAIENQVYIVAPAQYGQHNPKRRSYGKSMIVDPWGTVLATAPDCEAVITAEIDLDLQNNIREELPVLKHIRLLVQ